MSTLFAATALRDGNGPDVSLRELMDARRGETLGRLIQQAKEQLGLSDGLAQELEVALPERNWLIHRFYGDFAPAVFNDELRSRAMEKLREVREVLDLAMQNVSAEAYSRLLSAGFTAEQIEIGAREATARYIREVLRDE